MNARALRIWGICVAGIVFGSATARAGSELSSLPPTPPKKQTIYYYGKSTTSDFRLDPTPRMAPRTSQPLGGHLQYFPGFGLPSPRQEALRTDDDSCIELTPDFGDFRPHVPWDITGRTFSPDALGNPIGVKTAGGDPSWATFTLPGDRVGRSGSTYDTAACGSSSNTVNQIRINTPNLENFCLNVITDNTNR